MMMMMTMIIIIIIIEENMYTDRRGHTCGQKYGAK
jgi:hypothetical protein